MLGEAERRIIGFCLPGISACTRDEEVSVGGRPGPGSLSVPARALWHFEFYRLDYKTGRWEHLGKREGASISPSIKSRGVI